MIEETLVSLGLTKEEVEVYMSLLTHGTSLPSEVSKNTSVKRTYVYKICEDLLKKGLVTSETKGKVKAYAPASPDYLLSMVEKKKQEVETSTQRLDKILSELKTKYSAVETRPLVKIYEGLEGLKKIYLDTIQEGKEIFALVDTTEINLELREWLKANYITKRAEKNIHANVILSSGKLAADYQKRNDDALRTVREVDREKYPIKNEINIYGNKVAFIQNHKEDPLVGMIVENKIIAETMKAWFDLAWSSTDSS